MKFRYIFLITGLVLSLLFWLVNSFFYWLVIGVFCTLILDQLPPYRTRPGEEKKPTDLTTKEIIIVGSVTGIVLYIIDKILSGIVGILT
jgi:hypothetical protein